MDERRARIRTRLGVLTVVVGEAGVCRLDWGAVGRVDDAPSAEAAEILSVLEEELAAYARGEPISFSVPVDVSGATAFRRRVWRALARVSWGTTVTYGELARRIDSPNAARAVGRACGANPVPIIVPCHRVLAAGGRIGGFNGGLDRKRRLLRLEGVDVGKPG